MHTKYKSILSILIVIISQLLVCIPTYSVNSNEKHKSMLLMTDFLRVCLANSLISRALKKEIPPYDITRYDNDPTLISNEFDIINNNFDEINTFVETLLPLTEEFREKVKIGKVEARAFRYTFDIHKNDLVNRLKIYPKSRLFYHLKGGE